MKSLLWFLAGIVVGGLGGWYLHPPYQEVRSSVRFAFIDRLAEQHAPYLLAVGTLRGSIEFANNNNTVRILCDATGMTCEMIQADVMSLGTEQSLSLYSKFIPHHEARCSERVGRAGGGRPMHPPNADVRPGGENVDVCAHQGQP